MGRIGEINNFKSQPTAPQVDNTNPPGLSTDATSPSPFDQSTISPASSPSSLVGNSAEKSHINYSELGIAPTATTDMNSRKEAIGSATENQAMKWGNVSGQEYWKTQVEKHPESMYAAVSSMLASAETPDEKAKREKREKLGQTFSNLGNLIGNVANLYYTSKGSPYIDLNSSAQYENQRMQQIKDKREALQRRKDEMLLNARTGEINYARNLEAARQQLAAKQAEKANDRAYDFNKFGIQMQYNIDRDKQANDIKKEDLIERKRSNKEKEGIGRANAATSRMRANIESAKAQSELQSKSDKNNDYLPLGDDLIPVPKAQSKALFSKLYQAMKRDPQIQGDALENVQLQFGEGGDQDTKMMNIVRRRLNDSPSAVNLLREYLGVPVPQAPTQDSFNPSVGVSAPWVGKSSSTSKAPWVQ